MKVKDIIFQLEKIANIKLQESYDNSGLLIGNEHSELSSIIICLDCTEAIIDEAITKKSNLIISHHPIIFSGLKRITGSNYIEKAVIKAIKNDIAIYSIHTNLDNVLSNGVNERLANILGLENISILSNKKNIVKKLITYVPKDHYEKVMNALFEAGAGTISDYSNCSFRSEGIGTFQANENSNPFVGEKNKIHHETEIKLELVFDSYLKSSIIRKLIDSHPYEEVAYEIYDTENSHPRIGSGIIGNFNKKIKTKDFFSFLKEKLDLKTFRHTKILKEEIQKIAICGGSGDFLLEDAIAQNADIFITSDFKYHRFFDANDKIIIIDIGHYESEKHVIDLIYDLLKDNNIKISKTSINTNSINYYL